MTVAGQSKDALPTQIPTRTYQELAFSASETIPSPRPGNGTFEQASPRLVAGLFIRWSGLQGFSQRPHGAAKRDGGERPAAGQVPNAEIGGAGCPISCIQIP